MDINLINGFQGTHYRTFQPQVFELGLYSTQARGEARFGSNYIYLVKLHGSLSWIRKNEDIIEYPWNSLCGDLSKLIRNDSVDENTRSLIHDIVIIVPSTAKYIDTVGFLHGEMFRRFSEFLMRPQTCLFVNGTSLSDMHVNRLLAYGLLNPTFHLVLCVNGSIQPSKDGRSGKLLLSENGKNKAKTNSFLHKIAKLDSPQITWIVGQERRFEQFVELLPDPAIMDREREEMLRYLKKLFTKPLSQL